MSGDSSFNSSNSLEKLLDIKSLQRLSESFSSLTGLGTAILDLNGKVLTASGWQKICTEFHRQHPVSAGRCLESDTVLANRLAEGKKYNVYKCQNGLVDVAVPVIIEGEHLGNLFTGQFFFEPPDFGHFERQAEEMGFDKEVYLEMLKSVPVLSEEKVEQAMAFFTDLTQIICGAGLDRKKLAALNLDLEERIEERTAQIHAERTFSEALVQSLPGVMYVIDQLGRFRRWNTNFETVTGYSSSQINHMAPLDFFHDPQDKQRIKEAIKTAFAKGRANVEAGFTTIDGRQIPYLFTGYTFVLEGVEYLAGVGLDISKRVKTEGEKEVLIAKLEEMLSQVKQLSGFLPICASCKKIRDDEGYWNQIEGYIQQHSEAEFSHSICPECAERLYPGLRRKK